MENMTLSSLDESISENSLEIARAEFVAAESTAWRGLFAGFAELRAITYSSGLAFTEQLVRMFGYAEIIHGCESVINWDLHEILAFQATEMERLRSDGNRQRYFHERIDAGTLKLYVAQKELSHEKIYLLKSGCGKRRVVTGSANMSGQAFRGRQRENVIVFDGSAAYDWYSGVYERLKAGSANEVPLPCMETGDAYGGLDELPFIRRAKTEKLVIVRPAGNGDAAEKTRYTLDLKSRADRLGAIVPKENRKNGTTALTPDTITTIRKKAAEQGHREKQSKEEFPQLTVDADCGTATLNGTPLDLNPAAADVRRDTEIFLRYMEGLKIFDGNTRQIRRQYFKFTTWFLASPFMATLRDAAIKNNRKSLYYPIFGVLCGGSSAGKSSFLDTLLIMMLGQKLSVDNSKFTRTNIDAYRKMIRGVPLVIDDLDGKQFIEHSLKIIKRDSYGAEEGDTNYPVVAISANEDLKINKKELIKRTVKCHVEAGLDTIKALSSNEVAMAQRDMGTAFYRKFLGEMAEKVSGALDELRNGGQEQPDIFAMSSETIRKIIAEHTEAPPPYAKTVTISDIFGEKVTRAETIRQIRKAWVSNRDSFRVDEKLNELRYSTGTNHEAKWLQDELPSKLFAKRINDTVLMRLDAAREFFGTDFRNAFWKNLLG